MEHPEVHLSWSAVESVIRGQIEAGTYMDSNEAYLSEQFVRKELANDLYFYFRDSVGSFPEALGISGYNYPGEYEYVTDMLSQEEGIRNVVEQMDIILDKVESGEIKYKFRLVKNPKELRDDIADLLLEKAEYPLAEEVNMKAEDFITADDIDHVLMGGSGFEHGNFRIYDFEMVKHFCNIHTEKNH